jgi:hypothetical protein
MTPAPLNQGDAGIGVSSCPPEGFVGFVRNIAPGLADVVEIPLGPLGQFAPLFIAVAPDMDGLAQLGQQLSELAATMMIYHRFMGVSGHVQLLRLIYWL